MMHPAFNNPYVVQVAETEDTEGDLRTVYSVKTPRYMTPGTAHGLAILGQPQVQLYFHRALQDVLGAGFSAGFVVDALEETSLPRRSPYRPQSAGMGRQLQRDTAGSCSANEAHCLSTMSCSAIRLV